ncbi:MAG: NAD-dependent epimerase/dehydratase family protein [Pseudomonadota bacterium]
MKFPRLRRILLAAVALFAAFYLFAAVRLLLDDSSVPAADGDRTAYSIVTIFGASGTAGDGILKAALADPHIETIHVITRRITPRMDAGVADGKIRLTTHMDYEDYTAIRDQVADSDAVYWALGTSAVGMDEETYAKIHVDFPLRFVEAWVDVSQKPDISFHYISSSDISEDSRMMWARQKVRAEQALFGFAEQNKLTVIAYRPDYIGPTIEESHLGQDALFWFFRPVGVAVRARQIGQAMLEVSGRMNEFQNGDKIETRRIIGFSDAYERERR